MADINLQPAVLDLFLYAGDGITLRLNCTNSLDAPVDITGTVKAQVRSDRLTEDDPVLEFAVDLVDAYLGTIILTLTGDQTSELIEPPSSVRVAKFTGVWDVQWTPVSAQPRTLVQGKVECVADVTR